MTENEYNSLIEKMSILSEEEILAILHNTENELVRYASSFLSSLPPESIGVDVGCGRGGSSFMLAKLYRFHLVGLTISPYQAEYAQKQVEKEKLSESLTFLCADYMNMPLQSNQYDFIWMCESSEHAPYLLGALKETFRVAKNGARMILVAWTFHDEHPKAKEFIQQVDAAYQTNLYSLKEYQQAIQESGWQFYRAPKDLTEETLRYWKLRSISKNKTGTEPIFVQGYGCKALAYFLFELVKRK